MTDVQIAFEKEWDKQHYVCPQCGSDPRGGEVHQRERHILPQIIERVSIGRRFSDNELRALIAAIASLESSERYTRSACVQLVKLGETDGAEVMERHANEMLHHLGVLRAMSGIQSTQRPMPEFSIPTEHV